MSILFIVLPIALVLAAVGVGGFLWAVRQGQYDDLDTPPYRVIFDEEEASPDKQQPRSIQ